MKDATEEEIQDLFKRIDFNPRIHEGCDCGNVCKNHLFGIFSRYFFIVNDYDFHLDEKYT